VFAIGFVPGNPEFGGAADALTLGRTDRGVRLFVGQGGAVLDFDEGEPLAANRDEIDLAGRRCPPRVQDPLAAQAKGHRCQPLRAQSGAIACQTLFAGRWMGRRHRERSDFIFSPRS
jgi:hypothetical protein